jgi:hypothetical protein
MGNDWNGLVNVNLFEQNSKKVYEKKFEALIQNGIVEEISYQNLLCGSTL